MNRETRKVATEIADALRDPTRTDWTTCAKRWLLLLAPPTRRRLRSRSTSEKAAIRKELDGLARRIVFQRDGMKCRRCGRSDRQLQLCHVFPKGKYRSVRHDLDNLFTGCAHCHMNWWHQDPLGEGANWWAGEIGVLAFEQLKLRAQAGRRAAPEAVRLYLKQEAEKIGMIL